MALTKHQRKTLTRPLITMAALLAPLASHGESEPQQWHCAPGDGGQWLCREQSRSPGVYSTPLLAPVRQEPSATTGKEPSATANKALAAAPYSQWDWKPKDQLSDPSLCKTGCEGGYEAPAADWPEAALAPELASTHARADQSTMQGDIIELTGHVDISQGNRRIQADSAHLDRGSNVMLVTGNVELREPDVLMRGHSAEFNQQTGLGSITQASILQYDSGLRAKAAVIRRDTETTVDLEQASLTQCTPDDETWMLNASSIHLNNEEGWGSAKHARVNIKGVPVFYFPYMTFPINDQRKSGFLWPTISSSNSNGLEISAPYYLNLAPNYDATFTPRFIEKRGTMTELELRQLSRYGSWVLGGAYLDDDQFTETPTDQEIEEDTVPPQQKRWMGTVNQKGKVLGLNTAINYSKVSDVDYLDDLTTDSPDLKRTTHLNQLASLGYRSDDWRAKLLVQQFQTLDEDLNQQYQLMPQFSLVRNQLGENFSPQWLLETQYSDFQHDESIDLGGKFVTGQRFYGETGVSYPMRWAAGFIIPTAKVRNVSYQLDAYNAGDDETPSATTPLATLDMGLIFERDSRFGDSNYLQTLEPRLYYFYSDFDEQAGNPDFDTQELDFGYSQLFRDTRFSGNDRLDDANQTSIGVTSRFIDDANGREVLSLSLGQIFYFDDRKVQLGSADDADSQANSFIASEIQYQPIDNLWLTNTLLWDSHQDKIEEGGFSSHYQSAANNLYNLGYRFRREGASNLGDGRRDLSQVDASVVMKVNERWRLYGRYRYDVEEHRSLDNMVGFGYEDCCWMIRLLYQNSLEDESLDAISGEIVTEQDYVFILEFQLKGLGSLGGKADNLLTESILGYEDLE